MQGKKQKLPVNLGFCIRIMNCAIDGNCARRSSEADNAKANYILFGVVVLVIVTFSVINCTVRSSTAVVLTLCTAVSLFMIWLGITALASQHNMLKPVGSTAGSGYPEMANTMDVRVLVGSNPRPTAAEKFISTQKTTAQNCLVGAFNPDFIDVNQVTWDYNKIPVEGAVAGAGDLNGEESTRWFEASEAWRAKIAQGIRPDDNVVFDEDENGFCEETRIHKPVQVYDFSTTAHGGYGQRMIQEGIPTQNVPAQLDRHFHANHGGPVGSIVIDDRRLHSHGPEGQFHY